MQNKLFKSLLSTALMLLTSTLCSGCAKTRVFSDLPMFFPEQLKKSGYPGTFVVPVQVGSEECMFVIDTGASFTEIDDHLVDHVGKIIATRIPDISFKKRELNLHRITEKIKIGQGIQWAGTIFSTDLDVPYPQLNIDGILGQDILNEFILQLDFQEKRARFLRKNPLVNHSSPDMTEIRRQWGIQVPVTRDSHGFFCIRLTLADGLDETFILDTGCFGVGLLREDVFNNNKGSQKVTMGGITVLHLTKVRIGDCEVSHLFFRAEPQDQLPAGKSVLGTQFLGRFRMVTIDMANNELYLIPHELNPLEIIEKDRDKLDSSDL